MRYFCTYGLILVCALMTYIVAKPMTEQPSIVLTLKETMYECLKETGATEADFEALLMKDPAANMAAKCMRACLMKRFNLMNANGKFNQAVALQISRQYVGINLDKMRVATEITNICEEMKVSENHCEAAEQYGKCALDQIEQRR